MTIGDVLTGLRLLAGLGLIGIALLLGYASTALLDMNNFRTEGSPAGTGLFVVMLGLPPVALAALVGGILLLRGASSAKVRDMPVFADPPPPARREALWRQHAGGATLGMLVNGERAVLQYRASDGEALWCSDNVHYRGAAAASYPFLGPHSELIQLPTAWTVPTALAQRALAQFEADGQLPESVAWRACTRLGDARDRGAEAWDLAPLQHA